MVGASACRTFAPIDVYKRQVRNTGRIQVIAEHILRELRRSAGLVRLGVPAHGVQDLVPAAVIDAQVHLAAVVMCALLLGRGHEALQLRRKAGPLAEKAHLELVALHDRERFFHIFIEDAHDRAHFLGRAAPVFRGKGVDREVFDADGRCV